MASITVGEGQEYGTLASAISASQDGDVLYVQAGTYANDFAYIDTDITIAGVGGMVNLVATESPPNGKAILVTNADVTLDHLTFSGTAVADRNGAGIRYEGGDLVIENSYFHDNQNGLLAASDPNGSITIRNSEFAHNGAGDGYSHNLYVNEVASLTIADSYFHDAVVGHEIKSRAHSTTITGTRIQDEDGSASYGVDLPNGGQAVLTGNVIEQGPNSENPAVIHFGGEGGPYPGSSLAMAGNTVVNDLASPSVRFLLNHTAVTADISDTQVWGLASDQMAAGPANVSGTIALGSKPALETASPWAWSDPVQNDPVQGDPGQGDPVQNEPGESGPVLTEPGQSEPEQSGGETIDWDATAARIQAMLVENGTWPLFEDVLSQFFAEHGVEAWLA